MFDFHIHTKVSFDSVAEPYDMLAAAEKMGLKEICFTDHCDHHGNPEGPHYIFTPEEYSNAYDALSSDRLKIRRGVEMGLTRWNRMEAEKIIASRDFDFVIGSVHYADGNDPYYPEYWEGIGLDEAINKYLSETLECVRLHDDFDVLGHLNYVCKSEHNTSHKAAEYAEVRELADEIMKTLVSKGKGMEINTSGVDRVGEFLPSIDYLRRFRELGGEIVTIGSDAHDSGRIGQYANEALALVKEVFGYVCTFEKRMPVFHKL